MPQPRWLVEEGKTYTSTPSISDRSWLYLVSGGICAYCERPLPSKTGLRATIDHIIPKSWGGPGEELFNKVVCCMPCNNKKSKTEGFLSKKELTLEGKVLEFMRLLRRSAWTSKDKRHKIAAYNMCRYMQDVLLVHLWEHELSRERRLHSRLVFSPSVADSQEE